jgi:hypothetical protein
MKKKKDQNTPPNWKKITEGEKEKRKSSGTSSKDCF